MVAQTPEFWARGWAKFGDLNRQVESDFGLGTDESEIRRLGPNSYRGISLERYIRG